jgi:hypothetical protein
VPSNDRRISCKRQTSRPHNHYVRYSTSALAARAERSSDALVGCMRVLGRPSGRLRMRGPGPNTRSCPASLRIVRRSALPTSRQGLPQHNPGGSYADHNPQDA